MNEQTLRLPLSGSEVIEAVLDKLREQMKRDCYLNPNSAYDWFSAKVSAEISAHDAGTLTQTAHTLALAGGKAPAVDAELVSERVDFEIEREDSPNTVRVETGQPVPTLTRDEKGRQVVKNVKYSRGQAAKMKAGAAAATLMLLFAAGLHAQPAKTEALSTTEQAAIQLVGEKLQNAHDLRAQADKEQQAASGILAEINRDVQKSHPGYHLSQQGQLEKDAAKMDAKPTAPAKEQEKK